MQKIDDFPDSFHQIQFNSIDFQEAINLANTHFRGTGPLHDKQILISDNNFSKLAPSTNDKTAMMKLCANFSQMTLSIIERTLDDLYTME